VHEKRRVALDERPCGSRVVEVDVAEQQVAEVGEREATLGEPALERGDAGRGPAVEERRAVRRLEQIAADDAIRACVLEVD
jgi:hypothetical protein